jgi:Helix-hairpin-helix motif
MEAIVATVVRSTKRIPQRSINRFSTLDNGPARVLNLATANVRSLATVLGISARLAKRIVQIRKKQPLRINADLYAVPGANRAAIERIRRRSLLEGDTCAIIKDVFPAKRRIMSDKSFLLRVSFVAAPAAPPVLARVAVEWAGQPFFIEQRITRANLLIGYVDVRFDRKHTLPSGPAVFRVSLSTQQGGQSEFRVTCMVLPSNPFSVLLSPLGSFVTGTFSARGVRNGNAFDTSINVTLSNGDASAVSVSPQFTWKFWDGGVGGSLVEQGTGSFGGAISVPAFNTWGGSIGFHSPQGSGVFNKFDGREDMTIEIIMTKSANTAVSGTITARTMFRFGVNVTKVAFEDFIGTENADLIAAAEVTRSIYERHDVSFSTDRRGIAQANAGGFESITSDSEARDLWEQWSGPNTNNNIDAFVVNQLLIDGKYDGLDGDIPGPTSHDGRSSGTVQNKSGFVDDSGARRLHIEYLGMLMGHELGHYLGLQHTNDAANLMLSNSGTTDTNLTYNQYRTIIRHGWVSID